MILIKFYTEINHATPVPAEYKINARRWLAFGGGIDQGKSVSCCTRYRKAAQEWGFEIVLKAFFLITVIELLIFKNILKIYIIFSHKKHEKKIFYKIRG